MAIEALRNLDRGNRVVDRCVQYLSQLSLILTSGTCFFAPLFCFLDQLSKTTTVYQSDGMLNYGFLNNDFATSEIDSASLSQRLQPLNQLPMDMDLSEFMINTDMDFLGRYYDVSRQFGNGIG